MQIVTALRRLGYLDRPAKGDHVRFFKVLDHPSGRLTIQAGIDSGRIRRRDVERLRERTKLQNDDMWDRALRKKLSVEEYDRHLLGHSKDELLIEFWRGKFG